MRGNGRFRPAQPDSVYSKRSPAVSPIRTVNRLTRSGPKTRPHTDFRDLSEVSRPDYFGHRAIFADQNPPIAPEASLQHCVPRWRWFFLLLAASSMRAQTIPATAPSDAIFLWLAAGISDARIQRLVQTRQEAGSLSGHATAQCTRALQKAGADLALIQSLGRAKISPDRKSSR